MANQAAKKREKRREAAYRIVLPILLGINIAHLLFVLVLPGRYTSIFYVLMCVACVAAHVFAFYGIEEAIMNDTGSVSYDIAGIATLAQFASFFSPWGFAALGLLPILAAYHGWAFFSSMIGLVNGSKSK